MSETGQQQQPAPAAGTLSADPAFANLDAETRGAIANHGWDKKAPFEAFSEAFKSFREAEKFTGVPKDQIARIPKDVADEAGWKALHTRLGVPEKPEEYDFKDVKFADGSELDPQFVGAMAPALQAAGVPKDRAPDVVKAVVKFMEGATASEDAETQATLAKGRDEIAKSWGGNKEANAFIVKQAVIKLGLPEAVVDSLEKSAGYAPTMQALLKIGQMMGEDKFIASPAPGGGGSVMTREQAVSRLGDLKRDPSWVKKVNTGDAIANREFNDLTQMIG